MTEYDMIYNILNRLNILDKSNCRNIKEKTLSCMLEQSSGYHDLMGIFKFDENGNCIKMYGAE